ncbi:MAG: hypothetical protein KAX50_01595 [Saprospiraceae bacterium]|nr:hypothetical protein [Saprospiraceae bacterium]
MKNQVFLIALKWAIIDFILGWAISFASRPLINLVSQYGSDVISFLFVAIHLVLTIAIAVLALRELEQKSGREMSAGKAFELMGYMLLVLAAAGGITMLVQYQFLLRELVESGAISLKSMATGWIANVAQRVLFLLAAVSLYGVWRVFTRAGKPGWVIFIPVYNQIVQCEIGRKPVWWVVLLFIPIVNLVVSIMIINGLSKAFGKDEGFTAGLVLLPFVFYPILGFGKDRYIYGPEPADDRSIESMIEDHLLE